MTDVTGLDHVQVAAPPGCEQEARRFYGDLLGLSEIDKPAPLARRGGVWFAVGGQQLHIGVQEPFSPARKAHPALRVRAAQLEALALRLAQAGARSFGTTTFRACAGSSPRIPGVIDSSSWPTPEPPDC